MTKEAELNAAEDAKRKEAVEAKNQLDSTIYQLEKTIKDAGEKLPADIKGKMEAAITDAKKDLESNDPAKMKAALENLQKLGAELYQQTQAAAGAAGSGAGQSDAGAADAGGPAPESKKAKKAEGKVVDADVEIVDEEKK
jgi:molecular chaperone DnaK